MADNEQILELHHCSCLECRTRAAREFATTPFTDAEQPRPRKEPGDPGCDDCVLSETGACASHLDFRASYRLRQSIGVLGR